jgi:glycosyltransferase involved in cell wall biosynthesis
LGVTLPPNDEYFYREDVLAKEEEEFSTTDFLLCPSDFVVKTFLNNGFPREKLLRHIYGVDETVFYPNKGARDPTKEFTMLFVGVAAVRKGVHFALEAWLKSPASKSGKFLIVGDFLPAYAERLSSMLSHPSVKVLGHIEDVPGLMRNCDIFVLPSIEEGFARVVTEAMASGCVPLASDACTELCRHMDTGLVHRVADVTTLGDQITMVYEDRVLLERLRRNGLNAIPEITWPASGRKLIDAYREAIAGKSAEEELGLSLSRP